MKKTKEIVSVPKVKKRVVWGFNPISRVKPSKKLYTRKNYKLEY